MITSQNSIQCIPIDSTRQWQNNRNIFIHFQHILTRLYAIFSLFTDATVELTLKQNYKILYIKQEIFICNICYMQWILFTTILKYIFSLFSCCSWESFGYFCFFEINNQQATKQQGAQTEIPENCMKLCNSIIIYFIKTN